MASDGGDGTGKCVARGQTNESALLNNNFPQTRHHGNWKAHNGAKAMGSHRRMTTEEKRSDGIGIGTVRPRHSFILSFTTGKLANKLLFPSFSHLRPKYKSIRSIPRGHGFMPKTRQILPAPTFALLPPSPPSFFITRTKFVVLCAICSHANQLAIANASRNLLLWHSK
ncbi:hypothetical protein niasHT_008006 [Heterodera trifolii]|uniref:Uncharacterized protein n=1 Tax=Heterodera trifolii TaxID=157864 RepID=A0ABD2M2R1_9BILA